VPDAPQTLHSSPPHTPGELCNVWRASGTILVPCSSTRPRHGVGLHHGLGTSVRGGHHGWCHGGLPRSCQMPPKRCIARLHIPLARYATFGEHLVRSWCPAAAPGRSGPSSSRVPLAPPSEVVTMDGAMVDHLDRRIISISISFLYRVS